MIYVYSRVKGWWARAIFIDKLVSTATIAIVASFLILFGLISTGNIGLLIVKSDSMYPAMPAGSLLVFTKAGIQDIEIGDTIIFREDHAGNSVVTHRAVGKVYKDNAFLLKTKGDSNHRSDEMLVGEEKLMGKAYAVIPSAGRALAYSKTPSGLLSLNLLLVLFIVLVIADRVRLSERMALAESEGTLVNPTVTIEEERVSGEG